MKLRKWNKTVNRPKPIYFFTTWTMCRIFSKESYYCSWANSWSQFKVLVKVTTNLNNIFIHCLSISLQRCKKRNAKTICWNSDPKICQGWHKLNLFTEHTGSFLWDAHFNSYKQYCILNVFDNPSPYVPKNPLLILGIDSAKTECKKVLWNICDSHFKFKSTPTSNCYKFCKVKAYGFV